ncbi:hypothetical protein J6590_011402 [Homalodisca vitripennis]|nr:hypothetical protein J6590_011402 [Homalodisca vitripennis]
MRILDDTKGDFVSVFKTLIGHISCRHRTFPRSMGDDRLEDTATPSSGGDGIREQRGKGRGDPGLTLRYATHFIELANGKPKPSEDNNKIADRIWRITLLWITQSLRYPVSLCQCVEKNRFVRQSGIVGWGRQDGILERRRRDAQSSASICHFPYCPVFLVTSQIGIEFVTR